MPRLDSYRRYGSIRILRDGRVRYSPWTFPVLSYLSFLVDGDLIRIETAGRRVMDLTLQQGRVAAAYFLYNVAPDDLRGLVDDLRRAGNGLERWIIPCIEHTCLSSTFREDYPEAYAAARELLESSRDLPVADHWKRVRETIFANVEKARAERDAKQATEGKRVKTKSPGRKQRPARRRRSTGETS